MFRQSGRLDPELIDWRAGAVVTDLYQEIYQRLEDHPIRVTIQLVERLHSVRGAVHGLNPDTVLSWAPLPACSTPQAVQWPHP